MCKYFLIKILIFLIFTSGLKLAFSQDQQYSFKHITTKQGLPSNLVKCILKDNSDFIWFGTDNGLVRYDGYDIVNFKFPEDSITGMKKQIINAMIEGLDGKIYIGTSHHGLQIFDRCKGSFTGLLNDPENVKSLSENYVRCVYLDKSGIVWIGTNGGGLNKYYPDDQSFTSFMIKPEDSGDKKNIINTIYEDSSGLFWIGTLDGLYIFDKTNHLFLPFDFQTNIPEGDYKRINCFMESKNRILWIGTHWGLFKYNREDQTIKNYLPRLLWNSESESGLAENGTYISNLFVMSIIEDVYPENPGLWIATRWGLNRFSIADEKFSNYYKLPETPNTSISTNQLMDLFMDNNGQLFIATSDGGVDIMNTKLNPFHQLVITIPEVRFGFSAASILIDNNNELWIGCIDGGIFHYDNNFKFIDNSFKWNFIPDKPHNNRIECIFEDSKENLWLGFYEWGLVFFDKTHKSFTAIDLPIPDNLTKPLKVDHIIQDQNQILWIGSNSGLFIKDLNNGILAPAERFNHEILATAEIKRIYISSHAIIWVSTKNNGLFRFKNNSTFDVFTGSTEDQYRYHGTYVSSIYEDKTNKIWFGSDMGLNSYHEVNDVIVPDTVFNEEIGGNIIQIHGDDNNNLWIFHTNQGLIRYDPNSRLRNKIKIYEEIDGLPFDKFNTNFSYCNSFYQSQDDHLFLSSGIGSSEGILWFHPDSIADNLHIPEIVLTKFSIANTEYTPDSNISFKRSINLKYDQNFFSFEFAALDYTNPQKNQYAYWLESLEKGWIFSGTRRYASYTGVSPGDYMLHIKGSNNDGYWNEKGIQLKITILPPFWKTWGAYVIYSIAIILILYSILRFYLKRQRLLHELALEQLEAGKLKEIDNLKTRFFTNISHELRTPLSLILGPLQQVLSGRKNLKDKQSLSIIYRNAIRLKELVDQLLSLSKFESGKMKMQAYETNLTAFIKSRVESFESLASQKKIKIDFSSDSESIMVWIDREKISQAIINLLSNAFKFTPGAGSIRVSVDQQNYLYAIEDEDNKAEEKESVCITISDTGKGIASNNLPKIFDRFYQVDDSISKEQEGSGIGLAIVFEMIKLHKGKIEVESTEGIGTTFQVFLPLGNDHLKADELYSKPGPEATDDDFQNNHIKDERDLILIDQNKSTSISQSINSKQPILLIIEDNPDMRLFIRGYFEDSYQIKEADNGQNGLNIASDIIPDIIISDVMMPVMDGYELCNCLKSDGRTCHIPVILLTARASKDSRLLGLETGADDFITKPFDGDELQIRVKNLVNQRSILRKYYQNEVDNINIQTVNQTLTMDEQFIINARNIIEVNLSNPEYNVSDFAKDMAFSRVQLHRKLRALLDQSATEFIRTIRLNHAKSLLQKRTGTISEIAYDSGFNNPTYFTSSFKKKFGITPSEFLDKTDKN